MTKAWLKSAAALLCLVAVGGTVAAEKSAEDYDSKTRGAIEVKGETSDSFVVLKEGKAADSPKLLNGTWEVAPGEYLVSVNNTTRKVKVEAGKKVVLLTGALVVEGKKGLNYYPARGKEKLVASHRNNPDLNAPIALFAGTYEVFVNNDLRLVRLTGKARVVAGKKTTLSE